MSLSPLWGWLVLLSGLLSMGTALWLFRWVMRQDAGSARAQEVASWIRDGARAYLRKLYGALTLVALVLGVFIALLYAVDIDSLAGARLELNPCRGLAMAAAFVAGALASALAGFLGMSVAVEANVRSAAAARIGLERAFDVAFHAGAVMGLAMVGLATLGMSLIYLLGGDTEILLGFSFGASATALLAKAGGGIYTKAADNRRRPRRQDRGRDAGRRSAQSGGGGGQCRRQRRGRGGHGRRHVRQLRRKHRGGNAAGKRALRR